MHFSCPEKCTVSYPATDRYLCLLFALSFMYTQYMNSFKVAGSFQPRKSSWNFYSDKSKHCKIVEQIMYIKTFFNKFKLGKNNYPQYFFNV
jgi:hypothetical protein